MENQQLHIVRETTTSGQYNSLAQDNSSTSDFLNGSDVHNDENEVCKPDNGATNDKHVFRQDIVKSKHNGMIGIVTEVSGDVDSDSSITDEDEDEDDDEVEDADENGDTGVDGENKNLNYNSNPSGSIAGGDSMTNVSLHADQVRVLWMDETESAQNVNDLIVVDRGFLHGDFVANAYDPTGQVGVVVDVNILVDLMAPDGTFIKGVSSKQLKRVRDFTVGDYVVLGPWLGRIDDVLDNVTVMFDDGSVCKVMKADPLRLKPVSKNIIEDANFPYYPGQRVKASSSSLFKNFKWLSGMWKPNRLEGTIIKVTVGSVFVYWIASAGYGLDSSTSPTEEQSPKNLKLLSCFMHANWQLGDWCLFPSASSSNGIDKGLSKVDVHDYIISELDTMHAGSGCDSEVLLDALDGNNESIDVDRISADKYVEGKRSSESSSCCSSLSVSKEPVHETRPLHRKKIRKVVVKRDKKARKKVEHFERALLIVSTRTKVDVAWQDSSTGSAVNSTTLIPVDSPGDHEFVAEQYIIEKASDDDDDVGECRRVGVVRSVNAKERTACVRWLKPVARAEDAREFDKEEIVSVYELEAHQDYDYCYGDVVVRLSPVSVSSEAAVSGDFAGESELQSRSNEAIQAIEKCSRSKKVKNESCNEASTEFSDLTWVGNITNLKNGDIEVTWADGMVSTVGPQAIYVVGRDEDDDESIAAGSEVSENSAGWETVDDNEMDTLETATEDVVLNSCSVHPSFQAHFSLLAVDVVNSTSKGTGQEEIDQNLEIEDSRENGRNSALSVPFAAFRFVTRLATGIFSRGQRSLHPFGFDSKDEHEFHSEETIRIDESNSTKEFVPYISEATNNCFVKSDDEKEVEIIVSKSPELRNEGADSPALASYLDKIYIFKRFDITKDPLDHYFLGTNGRNDNGRKWIKKVQQDWSILQNNLPDGIYVRVYEDRMDLLRAVIVGAYGTPYQDGLFFFDFNLTPEYPDVPPSAYYNSGGWRINPNLYEEGKVCLSLLNTWTGKGNEVWDPKSSSILQVLVSLQGLVLNSKPYFNEAGYDKQIGTAEGEKNSLSYNENTFLLNCKTMMYVMRKPPKAFEELIKEHFKRRGYFILKACDSYMKGQLIGSLTKDATASHKSESDSTSIGFKLMLNKIFPKLFLALDEVGADCEEFRHLLNSS